MGQQLYACSHAAQAADHNHVITDGAVSMHHTGLDSWHCMHAWSLRHLMKLCLSAIMVMLAYIGAVRNTGLEAASLLIVPPHRVV